MNGLEYWVYSAVDVERNEVIYMRAYPTRSILTTMWFVGEFSAAALAGQISWWMGRPGFERPWRGMYN